MNSISVMDQIIESLAFEVEAVSQENREQISTGQNGNPINVKIRIRKKYQDEFLHQGIISIPRTDHTTNNNEKIRLSSSDRTIMSFDVFMQDECKEKPSQKQKGMFSLFKRGGCLGIQTDEDYEYSRSIPKKAEMDRKQIDPIKSTAQNYIDKRNFTLTKNYGNLESSRNIKGRHKDFLGKCKPGGCLDPPYNEDKYSYVPTLIEMSRSKQKSKKINEFESNTAILQPTEVVSNSTGIKEQTSCPSKTSLSNVNYSNSIITYPSISSTELLNKEDFQKTVKSNRKSKCSDVSNNSKEFIETYYISPKKLKISKIKKRTDVGYIRSDIGVKNYHSEIISSPVQETINEQEPLEVSEGAADVETSLSDKYKPQFKNNIENVENIDLKLSPYKITLVDLRNGDTQSMNLINEELNLKDSSNNTVKSFNCDADSFIKIVKSISLPSMIPKKTCDDDEMRDINSLHVISPAEKVYQSKLVKPICERNDEKNNLENTEITNPEVFKDYEVFQITKENDFDEETYHQKENIFVTDTELSKPGILPGSKDSNVLNPDMNSASLNMVFTEPKDDLKEFNAYSNVVLNNNSNYSPKKNSDSDLFQFKSDSKNSLQNIDIHPVNLEHFDVLNKDSINKSSSFMKNDKNSDSILNVYNNNDTQLNNEQNLLDTERASKIYELQDKTESKQLIIMDGNAENNLNLSNKYDAITNLPNNFDYDLTLIDPTALPVTKESHSQVENLIDNDPKSNPETELEKNLSYESTSDKKSVITAIDNEIMETARKVENGSAGTKDSIFSQTNSEDLTKLNKIEEDLTSEPKIIIAPNLSSSTDDIESLHTSFTENIIQERNINIKPIASNLEKEDHKINEVDSILSLPTINNTEQKSKLDLHSVKDGDQMHSDLSINKDLQTPHTVNLHLPTSIEPIIQSEGNENQTDLNKSMSLSKNDLQKQIRVASEKLPDKDFFNTTTLADNADLPTEIGLRTSNASLNDANDVKKQKNDLIVDLHETASSIKHNDYDEDDTQNALNAKSYMEKNDVPSIYLNLAFQSFNSNKNDTVIRTLDPSKNERKSYPDNNILQIMTLIRSDGSPITIPIDKDKNLLLQITKVQEKPLKNQQTTMTSSVSLQQYTKQKSVFFDKDDNKDGFLASSDKSEKNNYKNNVKYYITDETKSKGNLQQTLDSVYNEELLPLHAIIKKLKGDVVELAQQQLLIKNMLHSEKVTQFHEMRNRKNCACIELLSIKR